MKYLNIQLIFLYIILDILSFQRRDYPGIFWTLLFSWWRGTNDRKIYYIYRPLQFLLFAAGLYLSFIYGNWYTAIAYLLAFSLYVTDLWYYILGLEFEGVLHLEWSGDETYWLEHFYQIGHYTWKSFKLWQFLLFSMLGTVILIISNFI